MVVVRCWLGASSNQKDLISTNALRSASTPMRARFIETDREQLVSKQTKCNIKKIRAWRVFGRLFYDCVRLYFLLLMHCIFNIIIRRARAAHPAARAGINV